MNLQKIIDEAREDLDDQDEPRLWSDPEIIRYANKAINRLCEEALLIADATTEAICRIPVLAGTQGYAKDGRIIQVREVRITQRSFPLPKKDKPWLEIHWPTWRSAGPGTPVLYCEDVDEGRITLVPCPDAVDTMSLDVFRFTMNQMSGETLNAEVEFHWRFHKYIREGVLAEAYGKQDTECFDRTLMEKFQALFERNVDRAKLEIEKVRYASQTVVPHYGFI